MKFIENIYSQDVTIFKEQKIEPEGCMVHGCGVESCRIETCNIDACLPEGCNIEGCYIVIYIRS